jgi:hypothetical protein
MIKNFTAELDGIIFEFHTMNVKKLQLFQVYATCENKKVRFHMQVNEQRTFHITDRQSYPSNCLPHEATLSDLIVKHGIAD